MDSAVPSISYPSPSAEAVTPESVKVKVSSLSGVSAAVICTASPAPSAAVLFFVLLADAPAEII